MNARRLSCEEVIEELFAYLDREVNEALSAEIDRHLEKCRDCFTRAQFERKLRAKVAETANVSAPERLQRRIKAVLERY